MDVSFAAAREQAEGEKATSESDWGDSAKPQQLASLSSPADQAPGLAKASTVLPPAADHATVSPPAADHAAALDDFEDGFRIALKQLQIKQETKGKLFRLGAGRFGPVSYVRSLLIHCLSY